VVQSYRFLANPGETFTHIFTVPGEYKYTCVVHEAKGMIGTIVVAK